MTREEACVHFLNDPAYKWMRLWGEILYALQTGHNPSREEFAAWLVHGRHIESAWTVGMREHGTR